MRTSSNRLVYAAIALVGLGGLLIFIGWDGAAGIGGQIPGLDYTQGQIPYVISGGIGGLVLVVTGLALLIVHTVRRDLVELGTKLDAVVEALHELRTDRAGALAGSHVVAGRTTYHASTCRLVEGRTDLQLLSTTEARDRGLAACRICTPPEGPEGASPDETSEIDRVEVETG